MLTPTGAAQRTGLSFPGAADGMKLLIELGIVRELTGKKRNRAFATTVSSRCLARAHDRSGAITGPPANLNRPYGVVGCPSARCPKR
jgi:hypothetical protein